MQTRFYTKSVDHSLLELETDAASGLSATEAKLRLDKNGPNKLKSAKPKSLLMRILAQFKDFLVIILIIAALVSVVAGEGAKDAIIIIAILIQNCTPTFFVYRILKQQLSLN